MEDLINFLNDAIGDHIAIGDFVSSGGALITVRED